MKTTRSTKKTPAHTTVKLVRGSEWVKFTTSPFHPLTAWMVTSEGLETAVPVRTLEERKGDLLRGGFAEAA